MGFRGRVLPKELYSSAIALVWQRVRSGNPRQQSECFIWCHENWINIKVVLWRKILYRFVWNSGTTTAATAGRNNNNKKLKIIITPRTHKKGESRATRWIGRGYATRLYTCTFFFIKLHWFFFFFSEHERRLASTDSGARGRASEWVIHIGKR